MEKLYNIDRLTPAKNIRDSYPDGMDRKSVLRFEAEPDLTWQQIAERMINAGIDVSDYECEPGIGYFRLTPVKSGPTYEVY